MHDWMLCCVLCQPRDLQRLEYDGVMSVPNRHEQMNNLRIVLAFRNASCAQIHRDLKQAEFRFVS